MEKNKVRFGLENLHVAFREEEGWETPRHIPGVIGFNADPEGSETVIYADNIKYYVVETNDGYTGEVETLLIPKEILAEMLGWSIDKNGALVEVVNAKRKEFALMAQMEGDVAGTRFVFYNCVVGRPGQSSATKEESITPNTQALPLTVLPERINGELITRAELDYDPDNPEPYDNFFDEVYLPNYEEEE